jgi:putative hydrolase of HD superfamily
MNELINFYRNIDKIKHIERKGWSKIGIKGVKDTIASHSYGASLIAWVLSKKEDLDENKLIKLMLIHDLIMAHIEDYTPTDKEYVSKKDVENNSFHELIENVPKEIEEEFKDLFLEYQQEKSEEAMLARECDKLDTLLQALMYSERLKKNELSQFISSYESKFKSETGKSIIAELKNIKFIKE